MFNRHNPIIPDNYFSNYNSSMILTKLRFCKKLEVPLQIRECISLVITAFKFNEKPRIYFILYALKASSMSSILLLSLLLFLFFL